jgi:hypothetical protein
MRAFGPVFRDGYDPDDFLEWLNDDPRSLADKELESKYYKWLKSFEERDDDTKLSNEVSRCGQP